MTEFTHGGKRAGAGRPAGSTNMTHKPKTSPTWTRFSQEEKDKLKAKADELGIPIAEYIRTTVLKSIR